MRYSLAFLLGFVSASYCLAGDPVILEQVISRHDPALNVTEARLAIGRDGLVYLGSPHSGGGYLLRMSPEGRSQTGGSVGYSFTAVAANHNGILATSEAHIARRCAFWSRDFAALGQVNDFLASDALQWDAPSDIYSGESGCFYVIDQHRLRILKVRPPDKVEATFSLVQLGVQPKAGSVGLRVDERNKRFLVAWPGGAVRVVGFDGKPLWEANVRPTGYPPGGFDLDADGKLYVISAGQETVRVFDLSGKPSAEVKLKSDRARKLPAVYDLRVLGSELIIKRSDPTTLFEVYDRGSGELKRRIRADVDVLTVRYPSAVWTESQPQPFEIQFDAGSRPAKPQFRVFLRPLGIPEFTELTLKDGAVTPPAGSRGLYQVRVTPDIRGHVVNPVQDSFIEIRTPNAVGSASIFTPLNRFYYGKKEEIPVSVVLRAPMNGDLPGNIRVFLKGPAGIALEQRVNLHDAKAEFILSASQTERLKPGRYVLDAEIPRFTVAPQYLEIGPGLGERPGFRIVQHGDYSLGFSPGPRPHGGNLPRLIDLPETVADHLNRSRRLGINLFVDRLGDSPGNRLGEIARAGELIERLKADPIAVAPDKAAFEGSIRRTIAGYGAYGIEEQAILLNNDAGLPIGTLYDNRKPEKIDADLRLATEMLTNYPAFRGWSWAANWWLKAHGAQATKDAAEKADYTTALKKAKDTGEWSPVLDTVSDRTFALAVNTEKRFRSILNGIAPGKLSVMTGPYRAIQAHPATMFANADEVDLHYQAEQIQPPQVTPHQVDFYKRQGKPAWAHPELWNDDGTGSMILPTLLQMVMRGVDGVGQSGGVGPFGGPQARHSDARSGAAGITSTIRTLYELLRRDGPWLRTLDNTDRLAIVVSTRMQRIETWDGRIGSAYFDTLFEAYNACLYAHRPASFIFIEDLKPTSLHRFKAILLAGQRVEIEPPLLAALREAQKNGVKVFYDGTCRPELVKEFLPLGISFDRVKSDPSAWQDDAAYYRFPKYFIAHAEVLRKILQSVAPPVAECANPEIMLTERTSADGRYIWAVNNTMLGWDPGLAWRATLLMSQRVPLIEKLKLDVPDGFAVHDVFAREQVRPDKGVIACDLRTVPARLYAILPAGKKPPATGTPEEDLFGPHVRDLALSSDGNTALLNTFNWDHNLYGIAVSNGDTKWRNKVGNSFAFEPSASAGGFAVQGFDVFEAEGYHLYALGTDGKVRQRFALFGLPSRATGWAFASRIQEPGINSFAVPPSGNWVASAGNLGLIVWNIDGKELWADEWWKDTRKRVRLVALDDETLVTLDATTVRARKASDGRLLWSLTLVDKGTLDRAAVSSDRKTLVLHADSLGGRLFVIRGGKLLNTIAEAADDLAIAADGSFLAAVSGRQLKAIDPLTGLLWTYTGDDTLRSPRIAPDGKSIAVGSELGNLFILDRSGTVRAERDLYSLPVPLWLPSGDLLAATWMGRVTRFDSDFKPRWERKLSSTETQARSKLLAQDATRTIRKTGWSNAAASTLPLAPNLLSQTKALIGSIQDPTVHGDPQPWQNKVEILTDGKPDSPPQPWLKWADVGYIDSGWRKKMTLEVDTFCTQLRLQAVTFVEDPAHPESWLRDMRLEWWDAEAEVWRHGPYLLSNSPRHSHVLEKPIEAVKFRFVTGDGIWPAGNIRLGELVFHGQSLGPSHPDVVAKRPVAVLFDENESALRSLKRAGPLLDFRYTGAFSGDECIELKNAGTTIPEWRPPFGHALPNWNFEIAENPLPGQYRYLRFAWKANSAKTTGISLLIGRAWPQGGVAVSVGDAHWKEGVLAEQRIKEMPPAEWQEVTIDLWTATKGKPPRIQALCLLSTGGGAMFDRIVLARTLGILSTK